MHLVGIDISAPALSRGSKRLSAAICPPNDDQDGDVEVPVTPNLSSHPRQISVTPEAQLFPAQKLETALKPAAEVLQMAASHMPDGTLASPSMSAQAGQQANASANALQEGKLPHGMEMCWSSKMLLLPGGSPAPLTVHLLAGNVCEPELMNEGTPCLQLRQLSTPGPASCLGCPFHRITKISRPCPPLVWAACITPLLRLTSRFEVRLVR